MSMSLEFSRPRRAKGAQFYLEDYWPYLFGIFVFAGLIFLPVMLSMLTTMEFGPRVGAGILACMGFAFAHDRVGRFSFSRFLGFIAFTVVIALKYPARKGGSGIIIPGFLCIVLMWAGGWCGIWLARVTGISNSLRTTKQEEDPDLVPVRGQPIAAREPASTNPAGASSDDSYIFTETHYRKLLMMTKQAWRTTTAVHIGKAAREIASNSSLDPILKFFEPHRPAIEFAFRTSPPEEGEWMVSAWNGSQHLSFVLTNLHFIFFGLDRSFMAEKHMAGKVRLSDITDCRYVKKFANCKVVLTLISGEVIPLAVYFETLDPLRVIDELRRVPPTTLGDSSPAETQNQAGDASRTSDGPFYHVMFGDKEKGPFTREQIRELLSAHRLDTETQVRSDDWSVSTTCGALLAD